MADGEARSTKDGLAAAATELATWLVAGVIALLPFARGLLQGRCLFFRDLARYWFPTRHFLTEGLLHGELRLWNPLVHEGFSDLPILFYPLDLPQLLRNDEWTYSLLLVLHVALAAAAMCALVRSLGVGRVAAVGGGLAYAWSGYGLSLVNLDIALRAYALTPLLVLTMRRATGGRSHDIALAALVGATAFSTLSPEIVLQGVLLSLLLSLWPLSRRRAKSLLMALALAAGLAAAPILLAARMVPGSERGVLLTTSLHNSVLPVAWLQAVVGSLFGDLSQVDIEWWGYKHFSEGFPYMLSLYVGATALAVGAAGVAGERRMRKRLLAVLVVGIIVCLGDALGLSHVLGLVPALRLFRYPVKAFFSVQFALTLMVAGGLDALSRNNRAAWRTLCLGGCALGAPLFLARFAELLPAGTTLSWFRGFFPDQMTLAAQQARIDFIFRDAAVGGSVALGAGLLAVAALTGRLRPDVGAMLACAMMTADLLRAGAGLNPMVTSEYYRQSDEARQVYRAIKNEGGRVFTCDIVSQPSYVAARPLSRTRDSSYVYAAMMESVTPHTNVTVGVPTALSEDLLSLAPVGRGLESGKATCRPFESIHDQLRLAAVTHVVSADSLDSPSLRPVTTMHPARLSPLALFVYALRDPLPRFELATAIRAAANALEARTLAATSLVQQPGVVVIDGVGVPGAAPGRVRLLGETPGHLRLEVEAQGQGVLVVRDGFDPAWHAMVNAVSVPVWRANARHLAIAVPAGQSQVELNHRPWQLPAGLALGGLSAIVLAGLSGWRRTTRGVGHGAQ